MKVDLSRIKFRPMKAHGYDPRKVYFPCFVQAKLDGLRVTYFPQLRGFYSADGKRWNNDVVRHILSELVAVLENTSVDLPALDGEFYRHGWKLQRINSAIGVVRNGPTKDTGEIEFRVFDTPDKTKSFLRRWFDLKKAFARANKVLKARQGRGFRYVKLVKTTLVPTPEKGDELHREHLKIGYEGTMYRTGQTTNGRFFDQGYICGRSHTLLKRKQNKDAEYKVVAALPGKGKHVGRLGALVCVTKTGKKFNVGTGYGDREREKLWKKKPIGKLLRVEFRCLSQDGTPLEPRSMGIRDYA